MTFKWNSFHLNYRKQWKLSDCKKDINQVRVNGLYLAPSKILTGFLRQGLIKTANTTLVWVKAGKTYHSFLNNFTSFLDLPHKKSVKT